MDVVRVQEAGLTELDDRSLLQWAARHKRILLTYDVQTLVGFAWDFVS